MDGQVSSGSAKVAVEALAKRMQPKIEQLWREIAEAVNNAPDGAWINGSEMQVRDVFADLRRETFETALQMRLDAAGAAFSPGGRGKRAAVAEQRP
jgi:hypothetical protein